MTKFIASNSVTRRYLKRGELMAKRRAEAAHNALPDFAQALSSGPEKIAGWSDGNICMFPLTACLRKTANACTTERLSTSGLRACQRNSRVRANEYPFMLSWLLDVRRE